LGCGEFGVLLAAAVQPSVEAGSAFDRVIAHRPPAKNQVMFLSASRSLTCGTIVGMEMSCAMGNGVLHPHMPLKPLVQIASLSNVDRNPTAILGLSGIDVQAGQWLESSVQGINRVLITLPGLPRPSDGSRGRALLVPVTTE
jgi:hypothetical protein